MLGKFVKDILGITAAEEEAARKFAADIAEEKRKKELAAAKRKEKAAAKKQKKAADQVILEAEQIKEVAKLTPKEKANLKKESWVDVVSFKVNPDDIRNGFYELDWNDLFITELKQAGYGFDGDPDEEIVSRWFRDICINAAAVEGVDMSDRATGVVDVPEILKKNNRK